MVTEYNQLRPNEMFLIEARRIETLFWNNSYSGDGRIVVDAKIVLKCIDVDGIDKVFYYSSYWVIVSKHQRCEKLLLYES